MNKELPMYYVNVNDQYFRFVDVPGDGDCFYHSVLRDYELGKRFDDVQSLREFLRAWSLFGSKMTRCYVVYLCLKGRITSRGTLPHHVRVHGLRCLICWCFLMFSKWTWFQLVTTWMGLLSTTCAYTFLMQNQHLEPSFQDLIPEKPVVHVFFHTFGSPLQKISNGNHFAYLEPIPTPNFLVGTHKIKAVGGISVEKEMKYKFTSLKDWVSKKKWS